MSLMKLLKSTTKTINQRVTNFDIRSIFILEQKEYPFYDIIEVDILKVSDGIIEYRTLICSKYDMKWNKWTNVKKIKINELIIEIREEKINSILLT